MYRHQTIIVQVNNFFLDNIFKIWFLEMLTMEYKDCVLKYVLLITIENKMSTNFNFVLFKNPS